MKQKILKITLLFLILTLVILTQKVDAAFSSNDPTTTSGGTVTITVTSSEGIDNYDMKLGNHIGLTLAGCSAPAGAVANSSNGAISGSGIGIGFKTLGTYTFKAPDVTATTKYTVQFNINGVTNTSTVIVNPASNSTSTTTTTEKPNSTTQSQPETQTPQKSNNAKLSNLGFTPNDFKGFTPSKTSYSATVPNSVSSVNIYANKGQNGQTITGTGKKDLQEGVNQFSIVVTAEDGTTKNTYNLSITREAAKEEEDKTEENEDITNTEETETEEEIKVGLEKLTIDGITLSPSFKKDVYEYTAKLIGDKTKLDISTTAIDEGQIIEVIGNEDLKEGENVITITVQSDDEKETATYQITVNKSLVDEEAIAREKAEAEKQEKEKQQRIIIIAVIVVAIIVVGIILLVRYIKYRNSDEEYFDEDEEDESYYEEMQKPKSLNNIRETADDIINNLGKEEEPEPEETEKEEYKEENYDYQDFEEIERKARKKKSKGKRFKED